MKKMAGRPSSYSYNFKKKGRTIQNFFGNSEWFFYFKGLLSQPPHLCTALFAFYLCSGAYVTAPFITRSAS
ncbi:MAG TPA: hypothetical protein H9718_05360, partial [Candidatus Limosilactobacillus gallistercoris]|nr:hypothetical protein [Candidatus Limosilactobacillus gallistercoris]